jgi:hypothetical protein
MSGLEQLGPIAQALLDCVEVNLTVPVGRSLIMPGDRVVWDDCCDGQLWVKVDSIQGARSMREPAVQPCAATYNVTLSVGVVRCASMLDDQGNIPTTAAMTADALTVLQDYADVLAGITCCFAPQELVAALRIQDWTPVGPEGGCVGGTVGVSFTFNPCQPCHEQ